MNKCDPKPNPDMAGYIKSAKLRLPEGYALPEPQGRQKSFTSMREAHYRGKTIRVETTYKITIDGEPIGTHTTVGNDGSVHCYGFPNYSFPSAMDMTRKIVDASFFEMPKEELPRGGTGHSGGHA